MDVSVIPIPGQEHLPFAEVHPAGPVDERWWRAASAAARELGKPGLEIWTYEDEPATLAFLAERGYEEVRRYLRSELDVAAAPEPEPPGLPLVTIAERPDLAAQVHAVALEAYPDQPGREGTDIGTLERWRRWGLDPHEPEAYFLALDGDHVVGFAFLELEGDAATHGFTGVARDARGRGVATALKCAQIAWAKRNGLRTLRTFNEQRIVAIRRLNERYGYQPLPAEVVLRGPLASLD